MNKIRNRKIKLWTMRSWSRKKTKMTKKKKNKFAFLQLKSKTSEQVMRRRILFCSQRGSTLRIQIYILTVKPNLLTCEEI